MEISPGETLPVEIPTDEVRNKDVNFYAALRVNVCSADPKITISIECGKLQQLPQQSSQDFGKNHQGLGLQAHEEDHYKS